MIGSGRDHESVRTLEESALTMLPIGYMLKKIIAPPAWIDAPSVGYVYSVSRCVSKGFMDYIGIM
jgi:hypothetical protein